MALAADDEFPTEHLFTLEIKGFHSPVGTVATDETLSAQSEGNSIENAEGPEISNGIDLNTRCLRRLLVDRDSYDEQTQLSCDRRSADSTTSRASRKSLFGRLSFGRG